MKAILAAAILALSVNAQAITVAEAKAVIQELSQKQNRTKEESALLKLAIMRVAGSFSIVQE